MTIKPFYHIFLCLILMNIFPAPGICQVQLNNGLIAYYPFNGNANDATGNGNNASFNNATLTTDRFGNANSAYSFDGVGSYIQIPNAAALNPSNALSIALYFNPARNGLQTLIGKIDYAQGNATQFQVAMDFSLYPGVLFGVNPASNGCTGVPLNSSYANTGGTVSTDQWHCVVGTFDNGVQKIYLDGALMQTQNANFTTLNQCANTQIQIGQWWTGGLQPYQGKIDDVRFYDRALNADEVGALCSLQACAPLQGSLTGSNICSGNTLGLLTFHSPNKTGPFTLTYSDGTNTYTQENVRDSVPFIVQSTPQVTTTYTVLSIEDTTNCPPTLVSGIAAAINVGNCSLCTGSLGDPVVNITFGSGSNPGQPLPTIVPGASTTLQYVSVTGNPAAPTPLDGQYTITNNVPANPAWFSGAADHTPNDPNGYMAFYNSSEQPGEFYNQTVGDLCGSTTYQFSAWIANVLNPAILIGVKPDITFIIEQTDGTVLAVYDTGPIGQNSSLTWLQYGFDFATPPGISTVILKMINNSPGGVANVGNDLAIDDITFRPCGPVSSSSFSAGSSVDSIALCAGMDTVVFGNVSGGYTNAAYLWQMSSDSGATWTDIPNSNTLQLAIGPPASGSTRTYQYRLVSAEASNINSSNCRVVSNLLYLTSLYFPIPDFSFDEDVCNPLQVQFSGIILPGANYDWLIDGVAYSGNQHPSHTFNQFGSYPIKLKISSPAGCGDSITKTILFLVTPADIIATRDTTICIGKGLTLNTIPVLDFCWSPATYLDNAALADPVSTPPVATKYYFTAKILGANIIANGNFSGGNTSFTSDYQYSGSGLPAPVYFVGANPAAWNPAMSSCKDHSSGSGKMLLVNGSGQPGTRVWTQTVNVQPNTNYAFSAWLQSISTISPATLQFSVNGLPLGGPLQAGSSACVWSSFYTTWNSGSQTTAVIAIVNQSPASAGNGFALDDLSFAPVSMQIDSVTVSVETPSVAAFPDTAICRSAPVSLHATGSATYSWSPGATLSDSTIANPVAISPITTFYTVTGTSANGCIAKNSVLVTIFPYTAVIITPDTAICLGDPEQLQANGALTYSWSPSQYLDDPNIANPIAHPVKTTRFFLTASDANQCNEIDSVTLRIRPVPLFRAPPDNVIVCQGYSVKLGNTGANEYIYVWSPAGSLNDPSSPNPIASPPANTLYNLQISDSVCDHYDSAFDVSVLVKPSPVVAAQKANDIDCSIPTSQLNAIGAASYIWSPAEGLSDPRTANPVASIDSTTTFIVMGTDNNGCSAFDSVTVNVTNAGKNLFIVPNAFSPNGDGHNDCFGIRRWGNVSVEEFSIFNRWGMRVFTTRNPAECWDGSFGGKPQEAGVYAYIIRAHSFCGEITRSGTVILVR